MILNALARSGVRDSELVAHLLHTMLAHGLVAGSHYSRQPSTPPPPPSRSRSPGTSGGIDAQSVSMALHAVAALNMPEVLVGEEVCLLLQELLASPPQAHAAVGVANIAWAVAVLSVPRELKRSVRKWLFAGAGLHAHTAVMDRDSLQQVQQFLLDCALADSTDLIGGNLMGSNNSYDSSSLASHKSSSSSSPSGASTWTLKDIRKERLKVMTAAMSAPSFLDSQTLSYSISPTGTRAREQSAERANNAAITYDTGLSYTADHSGATVVRAGEPPSASPRSPHQMSAARPLASKPTKRKQKAAAQETHKNPAASLAPASLEEASKSLEDGSKDADCASTGQARSSPNASTPASEVPKDKDLTRLQEQATEARADAAQRHRADASHAQETASRSPHASSPGPHPTHPQPASRSSATVIRLSEVKEDGVYYVAPPPVTPLDLYDDLPPVTPAGGGAGEQNDTQVLAKVGAGGELDTGRRAKYAGRGGGKVGGRQGRADVTVSELQEDVARTLRAMGYHVEVEVLVRMPARHSLYMHASRPGSYDSIYACLSCNTYAQGLGYL